MPEPFIVLDPTLEVETTRRERAPRPEKIHTIGLLDNGKPNSDKLLQKIAAMLETRYPGVQINYYRKPGAYRPAPNALLDRIAEECDAALVGIGDWGSCSSCSVYDGLMIEQRGTAAAVICTEQFISSARMTAQTFGMDGYPIAVILHPIGRVTDQELDERAEVALPQVLELLVR